jgi:HEPN domain-containing protein
MKRATREWIEKADEDFRVAKYIADGDEPFHDVVCFHCQQCAEKYLKSLLEEQNAYVEKTHDLEKLLAELLPIHATLRSLRRGLAFLTDFAIDPRYPGKRLKKRQAQAALRWAGKVREACRGLLRL